MELEKEKEIALKLIKSEEESVAVDFLCSELLRDLEDYNNLLTDASQKDEHLNDTVFFLNAFTLFGSLGVFISSFNHIGLKFLAFSGLLIMMTELLGRDGILRRWSKTRVMQNIWGFIVRPRVFAKDIAFSRVVDKTDMLLSQIGENKTKILIARIYQDLDKKDYNKALKTTFARILNCYKQENREEILKELLRVSGNLKRIMRTQRDDSMADNIAKDLIESCKLDRLTKMNIFKKRESYNL